MSSCRCARFGSSVRWSCRACQADVRSATHAGGDVGVGDDDVPGPVDPGAPGGGTRGCRHRPVRQRRSRWTPARRSPRDELPQCVRSARGASSSSLRSRAHREVVAADADAQRSSLEQSAAAVQAELASRRCRRGRAAPSATGGRRARPPSARRRRPVAVAGAAHVEGQLVAPRQRSHVIPRSVSLTDAGRRPVLLSSAARGTAARARGDRPTPQRVSRPCQVRGGRVSSAIQRR